MASTTDNNDSVSISQNSREEKCIEGELSDEEEEEEEEPPLLKYTRLSQLPPNFFKNDPVSTATFSENVFVFGTHSGKILLTKPDFSTIRSFKAHKASIFSLYTDGRFFASGSMDGTIVIGSVSDPKDIVLFDYKRPIHAVVLDKNYQRTRSFIYGGMAGLVIYSSKNWLDQRIETNLDKNNGPITAIYTVDDLVLWMNDKGITVYQTTARQVISVISKPSDSFRSDLYWPRVSFPETDRILIAWGNYVWSLRLHTKGTNGSSTGAGSSVRSRILPSTASLSFRSVPEVKVEVEHVFKVDYLISGISGFNDDQWAVLAYNQPVKHDVSGILVSQCPDLKILSSVDGSTVFEEELSFNGIEGLGLNDYHMLSHIGPSATMYLMLSARDGIIAQQVQLDDRLEWYLERKLFAKAWHMSQHIVSPGRRLDLGVKHLDSLVKNNKWDEAADWLSAILLLDTNSFPEMEALIKEYVIQWNLWGDIFIKSRHVPELTNIIPTDTRWNLKKSLFTNILTYWLEETDSDEMFYQLIDKWDMDLYDVRTVTSSIEHMLEINSEDKTLRQKLCNIYENSLEPSKAVPHLCALKNPNIVEYLDKHHILNMFTSELPEFLELRFDRKSDLETLPIPEVKTKLDPIVDILVERRHEMFPNTIVNLMKDKRLSIVSFMYLERLAAIDELLVKGLENTRIELFSQFDRPKLLPFLMATSTYDISKAIDVCESNAFVDELVYLLGEIGENQRAMSLITEQLDDPVRAIKFAKMRNDAETWNVLLEYSFSKPKFIKALLEMADDQSSNFYSPMTILQNMTTDVHIEGLKESISKVFEDHDMNVIVNQLLLKIVYKRSEEISKNFKEEKLKGFIIMADDPEYKALANIYETIVLILDPSAPSKPKLRLVSQLLSNDKNANTLYTNMRNKSRHIRYIEEEYQKMKANLRDSTKKN
ncbi:putative vacuolar protein sorting-associated protein [Metschnikowia bicuspidata var. bicuspidata NRRL YB-4993]|uniref:Vacuolar protein sorting-associated protein 41 n=1 Tax=Metschnikowia bicuspidata var. bicuspidata NRRL YB-4993 TaxID=869754 RepID=A0A1A0H7Q9_9ASCO|nr:putative vacuolar protein sorting-associated protein [Metschnikowia bicuspidata var. bicuspidata NRRL YB-4993]OBA20134.1 putative vacuolar protein sorting-associated protein [Metschnikowia bicuspidata var. bicuspidata NRRL YB-4993]